MKPLPRDIHVLQPAAVAERWQCDVEAIYALIKKGALPAFSTSPPGAKRPNWRILASAVEAFETGKPATTEPPPPARASRRPRRDTTTKRFFRP